MFGSGEPEDADELEKSGYKVGVTIEGRAMSYAVIVSSKPATP